jgi:hypothetical protein
MIDDDRRYLEWRARVERARAKKAVPAHRTLLEVAPAYERRLAQTFMSNVRTAAHKLSALRHRN